jgi:hypothetical protein
MTKKVFRVFFAMNIKNRQNPLDRTPYKNILNGVIQKEEFKNRFYGSKDI